MEPNTPATACSAPRPANHARTVTRLVVDARGVRQAAWLRLFAAALAALSGVWLFAVTSSLLLRVVAGASLVFALIWTRTQLRALRTEQLAEDYLEIGEEYLAIVDSGQARSVSLASVRSVAIDEDRLMVVLDLESGPLSIEPRYRGVGLRELAEQIQAAVLAAREDARG